VSGSPPLGYGRTRHSNRLPLRGAAQRRISSQIIEMSLKPDEEFVKNSLLKYLGETEAWEGEDPPDLYIRFKGSTIAVEVTRLSPVSFNQDGVAQNRATQDNFGLNVCDELNKVLANDIPSDVALILELYVPVSDPRKYKKELQSYLRALLDQAIKEGDRFEHHINGVKVRIFVVPHREQQKRIRGLVINTTASAHIQLNAQVILAGRIEDKVEKCAKMSFDGPLWLALFNDYFLADKNTYIQAIQSIKVAHNFDRIYLIMDTGDVELLYKKPDDLNER